TVAEETSRLLGASAEHRNFVISSGCDIPPTTPWENIDAFFAAVQAFYDQK
ncbi:MAG: uroporphyrinogen decarboxylase family protein, partial [Eubacteriales bacterium]|nr:uroporphyrinogen decarboxylase family protein [Eubacteriales bacterium]